MIYGLLPDILIPLSRFNSDHGGTLIFLVDYSLKDLYASQVPNSDGSSRLLLSIVSAVTIWHNGFNILIESLLKYSFMNVFLSIL